ncbi:DUF3226 domain-containing protein [Kyrpidia spormannii]|uniref:DUF3226 domain-containing protein n=1 Tax=Kyrpidia spormannii TaxID=2055160 RepID=UPI001055859B|nr:DUF3226 domain-containing protein [Kyrpidia spormannii]
MGKVKFQGNRILLVEGKDDLHVVTNLCNIHGVPKTFDVDDAEGVEHLLDVFRVLIKKPSNKERIGIIVDADLDIESRWLSIRKMLVQAGYTSIPLKPQPSGTVIKDPEGPVIGIWIMPNNTVPGILEDFVAFLVPPNDPLWPRVEGCLQNLPFCSNRFEDKDWSKARLHTWLAWQKEPGKPIGVAISKRYLDAGVPVAQELVDWLKRVFA